MRGGARAFALVFALLFACTAEVKVVDATTQVTISIDSSSEELRQQLDNVRVTVARPRGKGTSALEREDWAPSKSTVVPRDVITQWPLDIPVIPSSSMDASAYFEVVVDARKGERVLAQMRGITRFVPNKRLRFTLWLEPCGGELGMLCTTDADCRGTDCAICTESGSCEPVRITDPKTLPALDEPDAHGVDASMGMRRDAGSDGAATTDGSSGTDALAEGACAKEGALRCAGGGGPLRERCEQGAWVAADPCEEQRVCMAASDGEATCESPCDAVTCGENAQCSVVDGQARCRCSPPYIGDGMSCTFDATCAELECDANKADCDPVERQCRCRDGYTGDGKTCTDVDECAQTPAPCDPNATCTNSEGSYTCACKPGFSGTGTQCAKIEFCATNPCQHGGSCAEGSDGPICTCAPGYTGPTCATNVDDCSPNPCQNGGKCTDRVNGYSCDCTGTGFTGMRCNSDVDDCASNPCMHRGRCIDGVGSTTCDCTGTGYTGPRCETNINDCSPNPCLNGGRCTDGVDDYTCSCPSGFTGERCETDRDECAANPCQNGGACEDLVNDFRCRCPTGFSGKRCEMRNCGNGRVDEVLGELCDYSAGSIARYTCDKECRPATFYTPCEAPGDCKGGASCILQRICSLVPCTARSQCPLSGDVSSVACEQTQCIIRCTSDAQCPIPETYCDDSGTCSGYSSISCIDDPFGCPIGYRCADPNCVKI